LIQEIAIANARERKIVMSNIGIAHSISNVNGDPTTALITKKTSKVGRNLNIAITTAERGNMIRGNAVFKIKR
jgi:hypothetical protein